MQISVVLVDDHAVVLERLSPRERQVLKLIVEGSTRSRLMLKLGIGDLPGLVKFAIRNGVASV